MAEHRFFYLARFVLEAVTPLSIGTGSPDGVFDSALVRDANDLPAIPASSLAGVLRHLHPKGHESDAANRLFGFQDRGVAHEDNGQGSRLQVAWCAILDSKGLAVTGLALGDRRSQIETDPLLAPLLDRSQAVVRNRVRIGPRGAADERGKFDRSVVPAGHRFAGEISLWSDRPDDPDWALALDLLRDRRLRLGAATRAGLGRVKLVRLHGHERSLDLAQEDDASDFRRLGSRLDDTAGLSALSVASPPLPAGWQLLTLKLKARDFWRIGQGTAPLRSDYGKDPDALPVLEEHVRWDAEDRGTRDLRLALVPGSAVKGALAHRVAYYDNCLRGTFAESVADPGAWDKSAEDGGSKAVKALFGFSKTVQVERDEPTGQAGRVQIDDALVPVRADAASSLMHNAIDRFTGGVRNRLLFAEEVLWQTEIEIECLLDLRGLPASGEARLALRLALDDLLGGRLPLGAAGGKGHGRFTGSASPALTVICPLEDAA